MRKEGRSQRKNGLNAQSGAAKYRIRTKKNPPGADTLPRGLCNGREKYLDRESNGPLENWRDTVPILYSGIRQVFLGLAAAAAVFLIGVVIGASITG